MRNMPSHENLDADEIKEILGVVSSEIPKLLEAITGIIYNSQNAESFGKSIATFYKELRDAGMDEAQAYKLTQMYMSNMSIGSLISNAVRGAKDGDFGDEIGDEIERAVEKKLKKKMKKLDEECGDDGDD